MRYTDEQMSRMSDAELERQGLLRVPFQFIPKDHPDRAALLAARPGWIAIPATLTIHLDGKGSSGLQFDMADAVARVAGGMGVTAPGRPEGRPTKRNVASNNQSGEAAISFAPRSPKLPGSREAQYAQAPINTNVISNAAPVDRPLKVAGRYVATNPSQWIKQKAVRHG